MMIREELNPKGLKMQNNSETDNRSQKCESRESCVSCTCGAGPKHTGEQLSIRGLLLLLAAIIGIAIGVNLIVKGIFGAGEREQDSNERPVEQQVDQPTT